MSSIVMNGTPACCSIEKMVTMCGWLSAATARASRLKRASQSGSAATSWGRILIATSRPSLVSRAIDLAHPARADQPLDTIRPQREARLESRGRCEPRLLAKLARLIVPRQHRRDMSLQRRVLTAGIGEKGVTPSRILLLDGMEQLCDLTPAFRRHCEARVAADRAGRP
jgi:hypothetical protein